ncbi:hypothetical protein SLE2022_390100 [Rubroshorea leprosula]
MKGGQDRESKWWKDICQINGMIERKWDWVKSGFKMVISEGSKVIFGRDVWTRSCSLDGVFPCLFSISTDTQDIVQQMGEWVDEAWRWRLRWRRRLLTWEQDQEAQLQNIINNVQLQRDTQDRWWWRHEKDGKYTIQSTYKLLIAPKDGDKDENLKKC